MQGERGQRAEAGSYDQYGRCGGRLYDGPIVHLLKIARNWLIAAHRHIRPRN